MTADPVYYKVLGSAGRPHHGGQGVWHLPTSDGPGEWMPPVTPVVPCQSGYHLVTIGQLVAWLGPELWLAEGRGDHVAQPDKHVFAQARLLYRVEAWNERTARLFAADCAEHVLPIFEKARPGDDRPRAAITVARRYANGDASDEERAAAGVAARVAAWAAAGVAARDAAWDAARDAERTWQTERLTHYLNGGAS